MIKSATQSTIANTQKYRNMNGSYVASSDYKLDETVVTSSVASVTFDVSSYVGSYNNLQIRFAGRSVRASLADDFRIRFNGSTSTYSVHYLYGDGSNAYSASDPYNSMYIGTHPAASDTSTIFGVGIVDILDVFSSNKNKTLRALVGRRANTGSIMLASGAYLSTTPISSITIYAQNADIAAGSRFSLYGSN